MPKKIIFSMSLTVLVLLTACTGGNSGPTRLVATATEAVVQVTATATPEPTPTLTATPTETSTPEPTVTPIPDTPTPTPTATATLTAAELERLSYPLGEDLIIRNRRLFDEVESFRFEQSLSYNFGSISYTLEYVCEQQGDNYHCLSTFRQTEAYGLPVTTTQELIKLGAESWKRENEGAWQNLSAEGRYLIPLREFTFSLLDDFTFESEVVATNTLAGQPVYKVELTPWDEEAFVEALLVLIGGVPIAWQNAEILVDAAVWIGQEDFLTYKEIGDIRIRDGVDSYSVYLQTVYSEYNQFQEITAPTSR